MNLKDLKLGQSFVFASFDLSLALQIIRNNPSAYGGTIHQLKKEYDEILNKSGKFQFDVNYSDLLDHKVKDKVAYDLGNKVKHNVMKDSLDTLIKNYYFPINSFSHLNNDKPISFLIGYMDGLKQAVGSVVTANSAFDKWLDTFLEEKGIDLDQRFTVHGPSGENHMTYEIIVEHMKIAPSSEQKKLKDMLVKLDFHNADIKDYFRHLAKAIAQ